MNIGLWMMFEWDCSVIALRASSFRTGEARWILSHCASSSGYLGGTHFLTEGHQDSLPLVDAEIACSVIPCHTSRRVMGVCRA